jgi:gluconokinase
VLAEKQLKIPSALWAYRLDSEHIVLGGALSEGGNVIRWLCDLLGLKRRQAESAAARVPADSHGLTILPFWAGERSPNWRGDARAHIAGLSLATSAAQIVRAAMEAITYRFMAVYEAMLDSVPRPRALVASGGRLVHSPLWTQMLADALAVPVSLSPEPEASSRGAALLALNALGFRPNLWEDKPAWGRLVQPRAKLTRVYRSGRRRQTELEALVLPPATADERSSVGPVSGSRKPDLRTQAATR